MWNETQFEKYVRERLAAEVGEEKATSMFSRFVAARDKVINEIRQIAAVEPSLTDHGPDHIANVFENAFNLISSDHLGHGFSAVDLYLLAIVILFHDAGNLKGRDNHAVNINEIYDWARGIASDTRREKTLVLRAVRAHTGTTETGSRNTLRDVPVDDHMEGKQVQLCAIAALLRFADELAEGPQRTSDFFRTNTGVSADSEVFHRYASCTHVSIDRGNQRIRLTYEIQIDEFASPSDGKQLESLAEFIGFVFRRITKLDEERRFARFYCPALEPFKQTDVAINFYDGSQLISQSVSFQLDDLVVPGESEIDGDNSFPGKCKTAKEIATAVLGNA